MPYYGLATRGAGRSNKGFGVDRKKRIIKVGHLCRLNYEEKRLYIHEIGGGGDVDNDDCYVIATSIDN